MGLILYFHGNTRSIKGWAKYAKDFYRYNYDVVLVDYRGFGKSTGKRGEKEMFNDMQVVYDTLAVQYHENHIIVYGRSLGSGFAAKFASDNSPRYLILMRLFIILQSGSTLYSHSANALCIAISVANQ